jgi:hypothetical protein
MKSKSNNKIKPLTTEADFVPPTERKLMMTTENNEEFKTLRAISRES